MDGVQHWVNPPPPPSGPPPGLEGFRLEVYSKVYEHLACEDGVTRRARQLLYTSPWFHRQHEAQIVQSQIQAFLGCIGMWQFVSTFTDWRIQQYDEPRTREPPMQE